MKKKEKIRKLQLHRETLQALEESDAQKVAGAFSETSNLCCIITLTIWPCNC